MLHCAGEAKCVDGIDRTNRPHSRTERLSGGRTVPLLRSCLAKLVQDGRGDVPLTERIAHGADVPVIRLRTKREVAAFRERQPGGGATVSEC